MLKGPNPYDIGPKSEKKVQTCSVLCCKVLSEEIQFFSSTEQFEKSGLGPFSLSPTNITYKLLMVAVEEKILTQF